MRKSIVLGAAFLLLSLLPAAVQAAGHPAQHEAALRFVQETVRLARAGGPAAISPRVHPSMLPIHHESFHEWVREHDPRRVVETQVFVDPPRSGARNPDHAKYWQYNVVIVERVPSGQWPARSVWIGVLALEGGFVLSSVGDSLSKSLERVRGELREQRSDPRFRDLVWHREGPWPAAPVTRPTVQTVGYTNQPAQTGMTIIAGGLPPVGQTKVLAELADTCPEAQSVMRFVVACVQGRRDTALGAFASRREGGTWWSRVGQQVADDDSSRGVNMWRFTLSRIDAQHVDLGYSEAGSPWQGRLRFRLAAGQSPRIVQILW